MKKTPLVHCLVLCLVLLMAATFGLVSSAQAHVKIGTYQGTNALTQEPCAVEIKAVRFENNLRHPLNERIEVQHSGGSAWTLSHPARLELQEGIVGFSNATLEATRGISGGADAFVIEMSHEEGKDGPSAFHALHHDYRDSGKSTQIHCLGLTFQEIPSRQ